MSSGYYFALFLLRQSGHLALAPSVNTTLEIAVLGRTSDQSLFLGRQLLLITASQGIQTVIEVSQVIRALNFLLDFGAKKSLIAGTE